MRNGWELTPVTCVSIHLSVKSNAPVKFSRLHKNLPKNVKKNWRICWESTCPVPIFTNWYMLVEPCSFLFFQWVVDQAQWRQALPTVAHLRASLLALASKEGPDFQLPGEVTLPLASWGGLGVWLGCHLWRCSGRRHLQEELESVAVENNVPHLENLAFIPCFIYPEANDTLPTLSLYFVFLAFCFSHLSIGALFHSSVTLPFILCFFPCLPTLFHSSTNMCQANHTCTIPPLTYYSSIYSSIHFTLTSGWFSGSPSALDVSLQTQERCWPTLDRLAGQRQSRIAVITFTWPLSACLTFCLSGSTTKV